MVFFKNFIRNKLNLLILLVYVGFGFLVLFTNISEFWLIITTVIVASSILFEFKFKVSFSKSILVQLGIIVFLLVAVILYAAIRDVYFENINHQNPQTIESSPFYGLCLSASIKEGDSFLRTNGYTENQGGSWINENGVYPTSEIELEMEELMTMTLFDCIEKQGATISDFDDVAHYPNKVRVGDYNCSDFDTWEEAQKVFIRDGGSQDNPYNLDANEDGIACESLMD